MFPEFLTGVRLLVTPGAGSTVDVTLPLFEEITSVDGIAAEF